MSHSRHVEFLALGICELVLGEIRQFEIVKEHIHEFFAGENEAKAVFAVAFPGIRRSPAAALTRTLKHVAFDKLLVSGKHHVTRAALAAKTRLVQSVERNADFSAFQHVLYVAVFLGFLDRSLYQRLGTTKKSLAILKALAARI